ERLKNELRTRKTNAENLTAKLKALQPATDEVIAQAKTDEVATKSQHEQAQQNVDAAIERVQRAKEWRRLCQEESLLLGVLKAAKERADRAGELKRRKERQDDLQSAVPLLKSIRSGEAELKTLTAETKSFTNQIAIAQAERDAALQASQTAAGEI